MVINLKELKPTGCTTLLSQRCTIGCTEKQAFSNNDGTKVPYGLMIVFKVFKHELLELYNESLMKIYNEIINSDYI